MNLYYAGELTIQVLDDPTFKNDAVVNNFLYPLQYFGDKADDYATSAHAVKIFRNQNLINSCLIINSGGATGIHDNSSLLDTEQLLVCCGDTLFCLSVPDLQLRWRTKAYQATCFQVFKLQNDYVVHGEMEISRINREGKVMWQFGAMDIFVNLEGEQEFVITNDRILLTDFENNKYEIDFYGSTISFNPSPKSQ